MKTKIATTSIILLSSILTLLTAYILLPLQFSTVALVPIDPLDPLTIPKFVNQLTGPPPVYAPTNNVTDGNGTVIRQDYSVDMVEGIQQILPLEDALGNPTGFPPTLVWGYGGQAVDAVTGAALGYVTNSPGPSFDITKDLATRVTWNNLITTPNQFAVDPTLHWANPNNIPMPNAPFEPFPPGYYSAQSPTPLVPHVHGGEVPPQSDGGPDAWWTNSGIQGPGYSTAAPTNAYSAVYDYPNINQESTLWYHDHALGITRLNVMSGLAGFYIVRDPASATGAVLPTGKYDMPLVFQDRNFLTDGSFLFPSLGVQPAVHPYWIPEFFGDVIMVNGLAWPNMDVDQGVYLFRLLDGSNARFYTVSFEVTDSSNATLIGTFLPFTQIASDGGYLTAPVSLTELTFSPGERVEILMDFSGLPAGSKILVKNTANENFPDGLPVNPNLAGQLMQFTVTANTGPAAPNLPEQLNPTLPTFPTLTAPSLNRTLTLVEVLDPVTDVPLELLIDGQQWIAQPYEIVIVGDTEDWLVFNPTADAHPIHTHLATFQVISRQPFNDTAYYADWLALNGGTLPLIAPTQNLANLDAYMLGPSVGPSLGEQGWKDTVMMNPGEVTRIRIRFAPAEDPISGEGAPVPGVNPYPFDPTATPGYVYHCHILDHEDNEMMRPFKVVSPSALALSFSLEPNPAYVGQAVTMLGNLTDGLGNPMGNIQIDLYVNDSLATTMLTNSSGWFTASAKVNTAGTYNVTTVCNVENYTAGSHTETLIVRPKLNTTVSFVLSPNPAKIGQWVLATGNITDADGNPIENSPLEVYIKSGAEPWTYIGDIFADSLGRVWAFGKITSVGTHQIAVFYRGSYKYNQSLHIETLTVNP